MKEKLSRIRSPWRRLLVSMVLSALVFLGRLKPSRRAYVHWIGSSQRPRRLERPLFIILIFVAVVILEPREYLWWNIAWGAAASFFVILYSFIRVLSPVLGKK